TIQRTGTTDPLTHYFRQSDGDVGNERVFWAIGHASGIGDTTVRLKTNLERRPTRAIAAGLDIRLPTGDQLNLLGTGSAGVAAFFLFSSTVPPGSPPFCVPYSCPPTH